MSNAPANPAPHKEPADSEEVYYEGSPPLRGLVSQLLLWFLGGVLIFLIPFLLHEMNPALPIGVWFVCFVVGMCLPFVPVVKAKAIRYRITNYRIDFEHGLISKDIDTLELWHVEDLHFHQSLWDRIIGVGTIHVVSRDESMPELTIRGVPRPRPLYEMLKQRVIAVKRARGVIKVDPG